MKKLVKRDKKLRQSLKSFEKLFFVLKLINKNSSFSTLTRWNAYTKLDELKKSLSKKSSKVSLTNRCIFTHNKKRFSKITRYSRHVFLKLLRAGKISGFTKSSW